MRVIRPADEAGVSAAVDGAIGANVGCIGGRIGTANEALGPGVVGRR